MRQRRQYPWHAFRVPISVVDTCNHQLRVLVEDDLARADRAMADAVNAALASDGRLPRGQVSATVLFGRVRLSGRVECYYERDAAVAVAWRVPGVLYVRNDIVVRECEGEARGRRR